MTLRGIANLCAPLRSAAKRAADLQRCRFQALMASGAHCGSVRIKVRPKCALPSAVPDARKGPQVAWTLPQRRSSPMAATTEVWKSTLASRPLQGRALCIAREDGAVGHDMFQAASRRTRLSTSTRRQTGNRGPVRSSSTTTSDPGLFSLCQQSPKTAADLRKRLSTSSRVSRRFSFSCVPSTPPKCFARAR